MASIFTKIVNGEIPCHKVWEDDAHLAFLDVRPFVRGHTLVIPKREISYLFDMSEEEHAALWTAAHRVAQQLKEVLGVPRICLGVWGWEVLHAHIHLVPAHGMPDFPAPAPMRAPPSGDEMAALARQLRGE